MTQIGQEVFIMADGGADHFLTKLFSKLFTTGKQKTMNWFPNARNYDHILKSCELHNTQIFVEVTSLITN